MYPSTLRRFTFSGVATGTEQVIALPGVTWDTVTPDLYVNAGGYTVSTLVPIQWEIKNDDSAEQLQVSFGATPMVAGAGSVMNNYMNLLPGQAYTQQKRAPIQEFGGNVSLNDLLFLRVRTAGASVAFSGTLECWVV